MPKLSVIVPVYNTEKYINDCVNSVHLQSYTDYELFLVDDGSDKDQSPYICDEDAFLEDKTVVIHKSNGGVSSARNAGIDFSTGRYITFVDSDDEITDCFLPVAMDEMFEKIWMCGLEKR